MTLRQRSRRRQSRPARVAMVAAVCAAASACSPNAPERTDTAIVAIGVGAVPGRPGYDNVVRGVSLAVERLNEKGAGNFRVRLPARTSTSAVRVAEQLRADSAVLGVVGHPESGHSLETLPVYGDNEHDGQNGVVMVSPTASSPQLSGISPWFFRVAPSDDDAARYVAHWTLDSLHARRAAVIYRNDSYGRDWAGTFAKEFEQAKGVVVARDPYLTGITAWEAYARQLGALRPDVLLFPGDADDAVQLLRALRKANVHLTFVGGDGTEAMASAPEADGSRFVAFFRPERATSAEGQSFVNRYRARYKTDPDMFAALSYDAALAIGHSVKSGAATRPAVRDAIERLGHGLPALDGVGGPIGFGRNHDAAGRTVVLARIGSDP